MRTLVLVFSFLISWSCFSQDTVSLRGIEGFGIHGKWAKQFYGHDGKILQLWSDTDKPGSSFVFSLIDTESEKEIGHSEHLLMKGKEKLVFENFVSIGSEFYLLTSGTLCKFHISLFSQRFAVVSPFKRFCHSFIKVHDELYISLQTLPLISVKLYHFWLVRFRRKLYHSFRSNLTTL